MQIEFTVNGQPQTVEADPRETLLFVLREHLGLRGTKYGCGEGVCGACTVILNGRALVSCLVQAGQAHGAQILTIEGMAEDPIGWHVMEAFVEGGAVQCGFCTPGLVLSARALLAEKPAPTIEDIRQALAGNLCRCTGYKKIVEAVAAAGERVASERLANEQLKVGRGEAGQRSVRTAGFVRPESLDEALALLAQAGDWQIVSGGTDTGVKFEHHLKDRQAAGPGIPASWGCADSERGDPGRQPSQRVAGRRCGSAAGCIGRCRGAALGAGGAPSESGRVGDRARPDVDRAG
jgi:aerobic-type carbon monoxide dehydrogenase small subunit (CoxS/CutS family)